MLSITRQVLHLSRLPAALDGFCIAHLSDLHGRRFGPQNEDLLRAVTEARPDAVAATGDMLDGVRDAGASFLELARGLSRRVPVFYSRGNHEQRMDTRPGEVELLRAWEHRLSRTGVRVLDDRQAVFQKNGAQLCFYGLSLPMACYRPSAARDPDAFCSAQTVERRLGPADKNRVCILLAHTPLFFPAYAAWGADVVLAGHVHGGLWRLPRLGGVLSPYQRLFPQYDAGIYRHGGAYMVLSRGLGDSSGRIRVNNPPEVVFITLRAGR